MLKCNKVCSNQRDLFYVGYKKDVSYTTDKVPEKLYKITPEQGGIVETPVELWYNGTEQYYAKSVACGPTYTVVLAQHKDSQYSQEPIQSLTKILAKHGETSPFGMSLQLLVQFMRKELKNKSDLFHLFEKKEKPRNSVFQMGFKLYEGIVSGKKNDLDYKSQQHEGDQLKEKISYETFKSMTAEIEIQKGQKFGNDNALILAKQWLYKNPKPDKGSSDKLEYLTLRQIHHFVLNYDPHAFKVFMFGQGDVQIFAFQKTLGGRLSWESESEDFEDLMDQKESYSKDINQSKTSQSHNENGSQNSNEDSSSEYETVNRSQLESGDSYITYKSKNSQSENIQDTSQSQLSVTSMDHQEVKTEVVSVKDPTAITFDRLMRPIEAVACGQAHVLILTDQHQMFGWGTGVYGAIGHGSRQDVKFPKEIKVKPQGRNLPVRSICSGRYHSMCITDDYQAFSWGSNTHGKLGLGHLFDVLEPTVIEELSNHAIDIISAGESHSAAINRMKKLYTWGNNTYGRLGTGADSREYQFRSKPELVKELADNNLPVVNVSCGSYHTFAITCEAESNIQRVFAFGENQYGKLGLENGQENDNKNRYKTIVKPTEIDLPPNEESALQLHAGQNYSMGVYSQKKNSKSGQLYVWGWRLSGQSDKDNSIPVQQLYQNSLICTQDISKVTSESMDSTAVRSTSIVQISCGTNNTVLRTDSGEIFVTGSNQLGLKGKVKETQEIGDGRPDEGIAPLVQITVYPEGMERQRHQNNSVTCKEGHILSQKQVKMNAICSALPQGCGKKNAQALFHCNQCNIDLCFDCTIGRINTPREPQSLIRFSDISCGGQHILALSHEKLVYSWGRNDYGQLAQGLVSAFSDEPAPVKQLFSITVKKVVAGDDYSAFIVNQGKLKVCGNMSGGKLGLGSAFRTGVCLQLRDVQLRDKVKDVACGPFHMIATCSHIIESQNKGEKSKKVSRLYAWGLNDKGQLGIGNQDDQSTPQIIQKLSNMSFRNICCGTDFTIALVLNHAKSETGSLWSWGSQEIMGKITPSREKSVKEPELLRGLKKGVKSIQCRYKMCMIIDENNRIQRWGGFLSPTDSMKYDVTPTFKKQHDSPTFTDIQVGGSHCCMIEYLPIQSEDQKFQRVFSWGFNPSEQFGVRTDQYNDRYPEQPVELGVITKLLNTNIEIRAMEKTKGKNKLALNEEEDEVLHQKHADQNIQKYHNNVESPRLGFKANPFFKKNKEYDNYPINIKKAQRAVNKVQDQSESNQILVMRLLKDIHEKKGEIGEKLNKDKINLLLHFTVSIKKMVHRDPFYRALELVSQYNSNAKIVFKDRLEWNEKLDIIHHSFLPQEEQKESYPEVKKFSKFLFFINSIFQTEFGRRQALQLSAQNEPKVALEILDIANQSLEFGLKQKRDSLCNKGLMLVNSLCITYKDYKKDKTDLLSGLKKVVQLILHRFDFYIKAPFSAHTFTQQECQNNLEEAEFIYHVLHTEWLMLWHNQELIEFIIKELSKFAEIHDKLSQTVQTRKLTGHKEEVEFINYQQGIQQYVKDIKKLIWVQNEDDGEDTVSDHQVPQQKIVEDEVNAEDPLRKALKFKSLTDGASNNRNPIELHIELQRRLKVEASHEYDVLVQAKIDNIKKETRKMKIDEKSAYDYDDNLKSAIKHLLMKIQDLQQVEKDRIRLRLLIKNSLLRQTSASNISIHPSKFQIKDSKFKEKLLLAKDFLKFIHLHPCYLAKIYMLEKSFKPRDFFEILEEIYPMPLRSGQANIDVEEIQFSFNQENKRINFLLTSFLKVVIDYELKKFNKLEDVDFFKDNNLIGLIFERIYKSQIENLEESQIFAAHILNQVNSVNFGEDGLPQSLKNFQQPQHGQLFAKVQDEEVKQALSKPEPYINLLKKIIKQLQTRDILSKDSEKDYLFKMPTQMAKKRRQKEPLQKQYKIFDITQGPIMLLRLLNRELISHKFAKSQDELIQTASMLDQKDDKVVKILLSLLFCCLRSTLNRMKTNLLSYVDKHTEFHSLTNSPFDLVRIEAFVRIFEYFIFEKQIYTHSMHNESQDTIKLYKVLQSEAKENRMSIIKQIFSKLTNLELKLPSHSEERKLDSEIKMFDENQSRVNFKNLAFHSMSPNDVQLYPRQSTILKLLKKAKHLCDGKSRNIKLPTQDPLKKFMEGKRKMLQEKFFNDKNELQDDKTVIRIKIQSRLLCYEVSDKFNKCKYCQAVLTDSIDWEYSTSLEEYYEPNQKRELVFAYCEMLTEHSDLDSNSSLYDQLILKRAEESKSIDKMQSFRELYDSRYNTEYASKNKKQQFTLENTTKKDHDEMFNYILIKAENQIKRRYEHIYKQQNMTDTIKKDIEVKLQKTINHAYNKEFRRLANMVYNLDLGIANYKQLRNNPQISEPLSILIDPKLNVHKKDQNQIFGEPNQQQKLFTVRAVRRWTAFELIKNGVLVDVISEKIKSLLYGCSLFMTELPNTDIVIEFLFKGTEKENGIPPVEKKLMNISITQQDLIELREKVIIEKKRKFLAKPDQNTAKVSSKGIFSCFQKSTHQSVLQDSESTDEDLEAQEKAKLQVKRASKKRKKSQQKKNEDEQKLKQNENTEFESKMAKAMRQRMNLYVKLTKKSVTYMNALKFNQCKLIELVDELVRERQDYVFNQLLDKRRFEQK